MKAEFELNVSDGGVPEIKIRHWDKSSELEQKMLGLFIKLSKEKGIEIVNTGGYLELGTSNSWDNYKIKIKE